MIGDLDATTLKPKMSTRLLIVVVQFSVILVIMSSQSSTESTAVSSRNFVQQSTTNESSNQSRQEIAKVSSAKSFFRDNKNSQPNSSTISSDRKNEDKHLFRIGLIVPRTAFLSQYKTYTQRIKDTFSHLLQLSRHPHQSRSNQPGTNKVLGSSANTNAQIQQTSDGKPTTSSCLSSTSPLSQQSKQLPWQNLTFNKYFDIKVVDLVNLAPRSGAKDVIDSICQKLIEQNVSVIIYLENNQDESVASFESQSTIQASTASSSNLNKPLESTPTSALITTAASTIRKDAHKLPMGSPPNNLLRESQESNKFSAGPKTSAPSMRSFNEVHRASSQAHFIMHLAESANIPMIAWSVTATLAQRPKKQRTLHLAPTVAHEAEAMLAILQRYSWYSFSVVSTTLAGHDEFILALRQFMAVFNNEQLPTRSTVSGSLMNSSLSSASTAHLTSNKTSSISAGNIINPSNRGYDNGQEISTQPSKA